MSFLWFHYTRDYDLAREQLRHIGACFPSSSLFFFFFLFFLLESMIRLFCDLSRAEKIELSKSPVILSGGRIPSRDVHFAPIRTGSRDHCETIARDK